MRGVVVANHSSWLDILALNISPAGIFRREIRSAVMAGNRHDGARGGKRSLSAESVKTRKSSTICFWNMRKKAISCCFFPEGTSTDGRRVLPFRTSLFQAFFAPDLAHLMWVQPVTVLYHAPSGKPAGFYAWWGEMEMFEHMAHVLSQPKQGRIEVIFHAPLRFEDFPDRKLLTQAVYRIVADAMPDRLPG
jgi:1-acyl-sn-glycerol-3-phosphate acyltransferase